MAEQENTAADGRRPLEAMEQRADTRAAETGDVEEIALPRTRRSKKERQAPTFDANAEELRLTWSSFAQVILCVNSYGNGITASFHGGAERSEEKSEAGKDAKPAPLNTFTSNQFHLRVRDTRDYQLPQGKYFLYRKDALSALERHLSMLRKKGLLKSTVIYFGTTADPFHAFHKKFDITTGCLELFGQYQPERVVVQTRSPMIIAGLPMLKALGEHAVAAIPVESHIEKSIARYTPGASRIAERLVAAQGLRRQGVKVNLTVSPVLPYGDAYRDAWDFAELLHRHGDYISLSCLADGSESNEKQLKTLPIAQKLAADQQFRWLRPHAYQHLYHALSVVCPDKLRLPVNGPTKPSQLALFAA